MMSSSAPEGRALNPVLAWWLACASLVVLSGWALTPWSSTWAGVAWLALCASALAIALTHARTPPRLAGRDTPQAAALTWLVFTAVAAGLTALATWVWHDPLSGLQDNLRLCFAAAAAWTVLRSAAWTHVSARAGYALQATAAACVVAVCVSFWVPSRDAFPSNAIPWAHSTSFMLCLLAPAVLWGRCTHFSRIWWSVTLVMGMVAIFMSQTRSALLVLVWLLVLAGWAGRQRGWFSAPVLAAGCALAGALLISTAWWPADPLRLREAVQDTQALWLHHSPDSPLGARVLMWQTAWEGIREAPWLGHGSSARHGAVQALAAGRDPVIWHELTHFHNEYLNAWYEHGGLGLAAVLLTCLGLAWTAKRLWHTHRVAALQLSGLALTHICAGMTNVNTAHNLYTLTLGLAVALALLGADHLKSAFPTDPSS